MAQILKDQCKARDSGALARVKFTNFIIHNQGGLTDEVESIFHSFICPKFLTSFRYPVAFTGNGGIAFIYGLL